MYIDPNDIKLINHTNNVYGEMIKAHERASLAKAISEQPLMRAIVERNMAQLATYFAS